KFEQATWDQVKNKEGKPVKRAVTVEDIEKLQPFHWGFEFDEIINAKGGFDAIITNPPWDVFKPNGKEFFESYSDVVSKKKMTIKEFEKEQSKLLADPAVLKAWLEYSSSFPHVSSFFRSSSQYANQISIVDNKKQGTDINMYKLFTEQCFNLLRQGGYCGIVIPSGIYTDLGTKQLRQMLFDKTQITGLFCFENRKGIFENVASRFKFVVLTFEKGGKTAQFPAAFMRHEVAELDKFPHEGSIGISVELVKKLSPDSLSIMEFKSEKDIEIAKKMLRFPLLGEELPDVWNVKLKQGDFNMTSDSHLFKTEPGPGRLPLYEGKMIHQFDHQFAKPKYWIDEKEGRKALLGREEDKGQKLGYQGYRFALRSIARNTDAITL
ncbi:MAG TPA: Eco57I restriction-modification methylase domain-containing protein, partial [Caldisericia bacterium]|nr:Eco57I restriction-modification methylase domain-containing protein [Caldisericia bacterium]